MLQLIRDREGMTRSDLAPHHRAGALDRRPAGGRPARPRARLRGGRHRLDRRPPADAADLQPARRRRARGRPRRHALAARRLRPRRRAAGRGGVRHGHRAGPESGSSAWSTSTSRRCSGELGRTPADVRGIGIGVPGPVAFHKGQPVKPPIMPGWNGFPIPRWFAGRYDAPVLVDNDVNIMALGEHWANWREHRAPDVRQGRHRHRLRDRRRARDPPRRAGRGRRHRPHPPRGPRGRRLPLRQPRLRRGGGGGGALARRLTEAGIEAHDSRDVVALVRADDARRCGWCARPAATSARCSRAA